MTPLSRTLDSLQPTGRCPIVRGNLCAGMGNVLLVLVLSGGLLSSTGWSQEQPVPADSVQLRTPIPLATPVLYPNATLDAKDDGPVELLVPWSDPSAAPRSAQTPSTDEEDTSTLNLDELRQSKDRRYRELKSRIDALLQQIKSQREADAQPSQEPPMPPPPGIAAPVEDDSPPVTDPPEEGGLEGLFAPSPPAESVPPGDSGSTEGEQSPQSFDPGPVRKPSPPMRPQNVASGQSWAAGLVDGPIDRLALADSLYGAGEIELALAMYREVDTRKFTTSERRWVDYQIAGCLRRLKAYAESIEKHRQLVGEDVDDWIAKSSRWWLDAIEERQGLEEELSTLQSDLVRVREMIDADASLGVGRDTRAASRTE